MSRPSTEVAKGRLDSAIRRARAALRGHPLDAYEHLLAAVWSRSDLLSRRHRAGHEVNVALAAFALKHAHFRRSPSAFVQTRASAHEALTELAEHLFADYPMPAVMTSAWLEGELGQALPAHDWYVRIGRGESLRKVGIPIRLTRAMAHVFARAPRHLGVVAGLRWAEVRGLGGSDTLAAAVCTSKLGRVLGDEDVHRALLELFVRSDVAPEHVGPIVDYVRAVKLEPSQGFRPDGTFGEIPPPEPSFELRGRTVVSLLRRMEAWHADLGQRAVRDVAWRGSGCRAMRWDETTLRESDGGEDRLETRVYTMTEIVSSRELVREGREMRHCVASYLGECLAGRAAIWSLKVASKEGTSRLLTVEIDPRSRHLRQARGRANRPAGEKERARMMEWAAREGLFVPERA